MQTTIAQQLIFFSFSTTIFMLMLVGSIMWLSMMRLMRLERLELAYIHTNYRPANQPPHSIQSYGAMPAPYASRATRPRRPQFNLPPNTQVDIQIAASDRTVTESPYQPRPLTERKEKIS